MKLSPETAEIIRRKKAQYCRFADTKQWNLCDTIFHPELTSKFIDGEGNVLEQIGKSLVFNSRQEWVDHFKESFETFQAIHMVDHGDIEQVNEDEIKAVFGIVYHVGTKGETGGMYGTGGGHYYETWVKVDGDWFMKEMTMVRVYYKVISL